MRENLMPEHSVLVYFNLSDDTFGTEEERESIYMLGHRLAEQIDSQGVGEFDGHEFGEGHCTLFMYGPDANALYSAIESILRESELSAGGHVTKRYGGSGGPDEVVIDL